ncbi:hypothetical protein BS329_09355 [Amycolatopsis coloradensis]|uniref:Polysaccharide chain length determinant N-terminal domain-containing protein n=1 Tax=Amycolatopsis coloradensis TaxID=76021 RepID=A0A1R0KZC6_9PSEU|nr:hypothetical protein [Amycolatopsis coloradensis]OLZ54696.1 hypothetical protein BS329_09355 [Amycolatopsis coloradensis]
MKNAATRTAFISCAAALAIGVLVLTVGLTRGEQYQGRVSLLAEPSGQGDGAAAQYGEVVSLALPALVELARSPSVLRAAAPVSGFSPEELGRQVSVELVPASGLARLSVRASSAGQAEATASALGKAMIDANLLAPVGRLRPLDSRPDVAVIAPDVPLVAGLSLVAAVAAGLAAAAIRRLSAGRLLGEVGSVRRSLAAAGIHRPVTVLRTDDPETTDRLAVLGLAAGSPLRVVPVAPEFSEAAAKLAASLSVDGNGTGDAVVAVAGRRYDELTAIACLLPPGAVLMAVVLA